VKRLLPLVLLLAAVFAGPALAQPGQERPPRDDEREQYRERMRQRAEEQRGEDAPRQAEGRDDRGERGGDGRPDRPAIRPEDIEIALQVLAEFRPDTAEELRELAKQDPQAAAERIARAFPRIREFIQMKHEEPRRFDLHLQSMRTMREAWPLYRAYHEARRENNEQKMAEIRGQLREHVATMFDIRLELRRLEIEQLRKQLQELEEGVKELEDPERRRELVDQKLNEDLNPDRDRWRGKPEDDKENDRPERERVE